MINLALLIVRATVGGLLAGHGSQKLFGWFGGAGYEGTSSWLESMNVRPGRPWAFVAGASEFLGGVLTTIGLLNPIGPLMAMGAMLMATVKVHAGKPIWVTEGGAELPVTNIAVMSGLALSGPGAMSLDRVFGIRVPRWVGLLGLPIVVVSVIWANAQSRATSSAAGGSAGLGASRADESTGTDSGLSAEREGQETVERAEDNFEQAAAAMRANDEATNEPSGLAATGEQNA